MVTPASAAAASSTCDSVAKRIEIGRAAAAAPPPRRLGGLLLGSERGGVGGRGGGARAALIPRARRKVARRRRARDDSAARSGGGYAASIAAPTILAREVVGIDPRPLAAAEAVVARVRVGASILVLPRAEVDDEHRRRAAIARPRKRLMAG